MSGDLKKVLADVAAQKAQGNELMKGGLTEDAVRIYTSAIEALEHAYANHVRSTNNNGVGNTSSSSSSSASSSASVGDAVRAAVIDLRRTLYLNRCRGFRKTGNNKHAVQDANKAILIGGDKDGSGHCLLGMALDSLITRAKERGDSTILLEHDQAPLRIVEMELKALDAFYNALQRSSRRAEYVVYYRNARKAYFSASMASHQKGILSYIDTIQNALVEMGCLIDGAVAARQPGDNDSDAIDMDDIALDISLPNGDGMMIHEDAAAQARRLAEQKAHRCEAMTALEVVKVHLRDSEVIRHISLSSQGNSVSRFDAQNCPDTPKPFGVEVPECFQCPISMSIMHDPVMLQSVDNPQIVSRASYERSKVIEALRSEQQQNGNDFTDPVERISYGKKMPHIIPNHSLKGSIASYLQVYPHLYEPFDGA